MKNKQEHEQQSGTRKVDIQSEVVYILKTLKLLEKPFSVNYVINIVTGSNIFTWKKSGHDQLATFGSLAWCEAVRLHRTLQVMLDKELIEGVPNNLQMIRMTEKGSEFLKTPEPIPVYPGKLRLSGHDFALLYLLKQIRSSFAEKEGQDEYSILPLLTLDRIVYLRPKSEEALSHIPGMGKTRVKKLATPILAAIDNVVEKEIEERRKKHMRIAFSPSFQKTKELWEAGYSLAEIAMIRGHRLSTVHSYLEKLHYALEIDMRPWIEKHVDSKQLYRGVEFFKQVPNASLNEAHEVLGISYDVLRKCKMYIFEPASELQRTAVAA